jgi:hypothetical protein
MKKMLVLGLVAILLTGGLVLMSCGSKCPDGSGDCTITSLTDKNAKWCGEKMPTDPDDAKKVVECAVYKESLKAVTGGTIKKTTCDC